jgi:hypothetical protein
MFGKSWTAAQGHIVDRRVVHSSVDGVTVYEFVADVTTASGEVFRAKVEQPHISTNFLAPMIGATVKVEYEDKSQHVRFDKDDPQISWKANKKAQSSSFDATLNAAPGTPAGTGGAAVPGLDIGALLQSQGLTFENTVSQTTVVEMDGNSPEGAALRDALLRAMGEVRAPDQEG